VDDFLLDCDNEEDEGEDIWLLIENSYLIAREVVDTYKSISR
jgi:hypothetical protein